MTQGDRPATALADRPLRAKQRPSDSAHVPFVVASLAFGLFGGFALAISLPIEVVSGTVGNSWVAEKQVHGHLQVIGFAGLFVIAMSLRFAPRFGGAGRLINPQLARPGLLLMIAGLLIRALGQLLASDRPLVDAVRLGLISEFIGATILAALVLWSLAPAIRKLVPHALLLAGAFVGLVAQAGLANVWLGAALADGGTTLSFDQSEALTNVQLFGFILPAILGVGLRTFPSLFGRPQPGARIAALVFMMLGVGLAAWTVALSTTDRASSWLLADAGQAVVGVAMLTAIASFGPWRRAERLAPASRSLAYAFHPALLWLAITGSLLVAVAVGAGLSAEQPSRTTMDAIRHVFAVGVVTLGIVGMAQLTLPEFASERVLRVQSWRGPLFGALLSIAVILRSAPSLAGITGDTRWWLTAVAGLISWLSLALFAVLVWRASRAHRRQLSLLAAAEP